MTKSEIFKAAHAMTKKALQPGDHYGTTFGAALKSLLAKPVDMEAALTKIGGRLWEKGSMRRIYFNDLEQWMGLTINRYNTGNISSARVNGERISNSQARRMLNAIDKLWFDLDDNQFYFQAADHDLANDVVSTIRAHI